MYKVLLVDDERPALQYLNTIIEKYCPSFETAGMAESGSEALKLLNENEFDVMLTDISMPGETDGIALAKAAKARNSGMHVIMVTGYAEFEYARGALQAGADEYLLKPVSPVRIREIMDRVKQRLDEERGERTVRILNAILQGKKTKDRLPEHRTYHFALAHIGNLSQGRFTRVRSANPRPCARENWLCIYGHDEPDFILIVPADCIDDGFTQALQEYLDSQAKNRTCTAVYSPAPRPLADLPMFLDKAQALLEASAVIGLSQTLSVRTPLPDNKSHQYLNNIRRIDALLDSDSRRLIQEMFIGFAAEWERIRLPQRQVQLICYQLCNRILAASSAAPDKVHELMREIDQLIPNAESTGSLMAGLYEILFGISTEHDKKLGGADLCEYTLSYIRDNFEKPLNIQTVCSKIGISQTYLSRLLRRYAGTSVNAYLTECRIRAAKKLLRTRPDMLLRDVASCVGYEDQSYFCKIFRAETGMTPKQFASGSGNECKKTAACDPALPQ